MSLKQTAKRLVFGKGYQKRRFIGGRLKGLWGFVDLAQDTQQWRGIYEVALQDWLALAVRPGAVCLDIGAAEGYLTLLMAKLAGVRGHVLACEPTERSQFIDDTIVSNELHGLAQVSLLNEFIIGPETTGLTGITVDCLMESYNLTRLDVVKIDVDGGEVDVLEGMRETLSRFHPHLAIEVHSSAVRVSM